MLLILIPIAWLAVLTVFVAICRIAAEADAEPSPFAGSPTGPIGLRVTLSRAPRPPRATHTRRGELLEGRRRAPRRRQVAAHGIR